MESKAKFVPKSLRNNVSDNMVLLVVTMFPDKMEVYDDVEFKNLSDRLESLLPVPLWVIQSKKLPFTMLQDATMILNYDEVQEVKSLIKLSLLHGDRFASTPKSLMSYGLMYPVRVYAGFDLSSLDIVDRNALMGDFEVDDDVVTGGFVRLKTKAQVSEWEQSLGVKLADVNWFFECKPEALKEC